MLLGALQIFTGALLGGLWLIFIGMFLRGTAEGGYQEVVLRQALTDVAVHEVMTEDVVTVPQDLPVSRLLTEYFLRYGYHGFPVTQNSKVVGVVSLEAVRQLPEPERAATTVAHIMRPLSGQTTIAPQAPLTEALTKMVQQDTGRLLVMQGGTMRGMITKTGLLRFLEIKQILEASAPETPLALAGRTPSWG
jgi:predicted transcriptional regulator